MKTSTRLCWHLALLAATATVTNVGCARADSSIAARANLVADDAGLIADLELDKWSTTSKIEKIESDDASIKNAVRFTVEEKPKNPWNASLDAKTPVAIEQGDTIEISFWLRASQGDGAAKLVFSTWEQTPVRFLPKSGVGNEEIKNIGPQWKRYFYRFTAKKEIGARGSRLRLMFGDRVQIVEVGGVTINVASQSGGVKATKKEAPAPPKIVTGAQTPGDTSWLRTAKVAVPTVQFDFFARPHQTWGFLGDSLTHSSYYHQYVQLFLQTRYPGHDFWTVNAGRSGDTASGANRERRLDVDLKPSAPDVVFVHFGMNDVKYFMFDKTKFAPKPGELNARQRDYIKNLTQVVDDVKALGAQPVLIAPTIYENTTGNFPGVNEELTVFAQLGEKLATEKEVPFFDINAPLNRFAAEKRAQNPNWKLTRDNVHPKDEGYQIMAYLMLKGLQPQPFVYNVEVDAANATANAKGAQISEVKTAPQAVSFTLLEKSLPFPVTAEDKGLKMVPFAADLNRQMLKVTGLAPGNYALKIDGQEVARADATAMASGINLAPIESTPQFQQALKLRGTDLDRKVRVGTRPTRYGLGDVQYRRRGLGERRRCDRRGGFREVGEQIL